MAAFLRWGETQAVKGVWLVRVRVCTGHIGALRCMRVGVRRVIRAFTLLASQFFAANRGITLSTNRRNLELRARATNDDCSLAQTAQPFFS